MFLSAKAEFSNMKLLSIAELTALVPQTSAILLNPPKRTGDWVLDSRGRLRPANGAPFGEDGDEGGESGMPGFSGVANA